MAEVPHSPRRMRVLTQHATMPRHLVCYIAMARQHGWTVSEYTTPPPADEPPQMPERTSYAGRSRHALTNYDWPIFFPTFARTYASLPDTSVEVVIAGDLPSLAVAAWHADQHGSYLVYAIDELAADRPSCDVEQAAAWTRIESYLLRFCDAVWATSEALSHTFVTRYGLPQARLSTPTTILPVPVQEVLADTTASADERPSASCTVLIPGPLVYGRNLEAALEAVAHLPKDLVLVFVGEGPLRETLLEQAATLNCADRVHICPAIYPALLESGAIALVPDPASDSNAWLRVPEALLWARQAGVPVIAQDTAGANTVLSEATAAMPATLDSAAAIAHVLAFAYQADRTGWYQQATSVASKFSWRTQALAFATACDTLFASFPKAGFRHVIEAAYCDLDRRDLTAAHEKLEACLSLNPTHPEVLALAASLAYVQFDLKQAQHYHVLAMQQDPHHPIAQRRGRQLHILTENLKVLLNAA